MLRERGGSEEHTFSPEEEHSGLEYAKAQDELADAMKTAQEVPTEPLESPEDVDALLGRRGAAKRELDALDARRERELSTGGIPEVAPEGLTALDYDELVNEKVIDRAFADQLAESDEVIRNLRDLPDRTAAAAAALMNLWDAREKIIGTIQDRVKEDRETRAQRIEQLRSEIAGRYARRAEELRGMIAEIESNPAFIARLKKDAADQQAAFDAALKERREKLFREATRHLDSVRNRHSRAFRRLEEITGEKHLEASFRSAFGPSSRDAAAARREQEALVSKIRTKVIASIIDGEGKGQLKEPREVVPWIEGRTQVIRYDDAMQLLKSAEARGALDSNENRSRAELMARREYVFVEHEALRRLFGKTQTGFDRQKRKPILGEFWAAFGTRKENDAQGVTEARRKAREEKEAQDAAFREQIAALIKKGGFRVDAPTYRMIHGKREVAGTGSGIVRLEIGETKKGKTAGNKYWRVAETFGNVNDLRVGQSSPLDGRAFPEWLRDAMKKIFVKRGENFTDERYDTMPENE